MADGTFPSVVSKDVDLNATSNPIYVQLSDGTTAIGDTSGALDVYITGGSSAGTEYTEDVATVTATGIANLAERKDTPSAITPVLGDWSKFYVNANGSQWVAIDGTVAVTQSGTWTIDSITNTVTVDGTVAVSSVSGTVAVTQSGTWTIDSITNDVNVTATDLDIRPLTLAEDSVKISRNTLGNSAPNPIFVYEVKRDNVGGIHDFDQASALGSGLTSNHDYTVANNFTLTSVVVSGSGNVKFEIQAGPLASLVTKAVGFTTGREGNTTQVDFDPPIYLSSASTGTIRVIRTNRQGQAVDVYSTIIGNEWSTS